MTNAVNVEFIVDKLLSFLASAIDDHFRSDLVGQITQCAERFAPSNAWYVQTIIRVFELAGEKVKASVAHTLTQLIAEGTDEDEEDENADDELRKEAVENFLDLLERPKLPAILANSMAWVLGEYGYLSESCTIEEIMEKLLNLVKKASDSTTKAHAISALIKLVAQNGSCPARVLELVKMYSQSQSLDVQQRAIEFQALIINSHVMADILPVDASCEDLDLDEDLSFLNGFVEQALNYGASPYNPPALDEDEGDSRKKSSLKITPYEKPALPQAAPSGGIVGGLANGPAPTTISSPSQSQPTPSSASPAVTVSPNMSAAAVKGNQLINSRGVAQVWGKKPDPVAAPTPPPVPEPAAVSEKIPTPEKVTVTQISTPTNQQQQYSAPVEPPQPKVLSEKEKFAAALFGGVGGGTSRTTATRKRSTTGAKDSLKASPTTAASPPAATVSPVMTNAYISSELLDMPVPVEPLSPAVTTPAPQPVSPQVPSNINDDFMGLTISPMPAMAAATPSMSAPAMAMQGGNISDMFASMNVISASASTDVQPLRINTAEFGRRWGTVNADVKLSVPIRIMTLEKLKTVVPSTYHHVESIPNTAEAIFAATLTTNGSIILIHTKLHLARKVCDILVKSSSKEISTREMNIISHAISSAN